MNPPGSEKAARARWGTALAALAGLAAAVRLPGLPRHALVEGDGVHYATLARDLFVPDFSGLGNPYWSNLWPGVIAATSGITGLDVVDAGRVASLVAGCALPPLVAVLGRRAFGPAAGLAAGLLAAGHPWLAHFSTLVFTESLFSLLLVALLLAAWTASRTGRLRDAALAGTLAGMGLTTRPEAFAATLLGAATVLGACWRRRRRREGVRAAAALLGVAALFLGARALLIHRYYHEWDFGIGAKGTANLFVGLAATDVEKERVATEVTPDGRNRLDETLKEWTLLGFAREHPGLLLGHVARNAGLLLRAGWHVFPPLPVRLGRAAFPGPAAALLDAAAAVILALGAWGLGAGLKRRASRGAAAYLAAAAGLYLAGLSLLNVHDRLLVPLVPIVLVFTGRGAEAAAAAVAGALLPRPLSPARAATPLAPLLLLPVLTASALLRAPSLPYADDPPIQREAGLWLRGRYGQQTFVMTASPAIAFYFYDPPHQDNEVDLPYADYDVLLSYARRQRAGVLAVSEWYLEAVGHPAAPRLLDPSAPHPGLAHVATLGQVRPYRVHVYEVEGEDDD